ncbi:MAG: adenylate/guanylate cyclase domain-containing protein [Syntrophobacteria bacterium]
MKVLLVEDEQSMLFTLTNLLRHRGHEVIAAPSAEKALKTLGNGQVDLVISDLKLPGMDGITLIGQIAERCQDVVPIVITAYGTLEDAIDALKLNVYDFLRKPFDLNTFEDAISRAENRRSQLLANKRYVRELKKRLKGEERKRTILSRFVSKHIVDRIMSGSETPAVAGRAQKVSVLFADISDFTGLSERLDQKSLVFIVNSFYSALEPIMDKHGGILDKFMGDGIMMVFTSSDLDQKTACRAVGAAIQIQQQVDEIRRELRRFELPEISIHLGVSTGMAVACSIGTGDHLNHTFIGDAVNLAKRLQELAGPGEIIVSESTILDLEGNMDSVPGLVRFLPLAPQTIKGRQERALVHRAEYVAKQQ